MKQLQNNFTTPEQSKRLLELGLPADSADCYHNTIAGKPYLLTMPYSQTTWLYENNPPLPCWSVGRLIEIIIVSLKHGVDVTVKRYTKVTTESLISTIVELKEDLDFSKLE